MRKQLAVTLLAVAMTPVLSGCVFSPDKQPPPPQEQLAPNDTPTNAMKRFVGAYEQKKTLEYQGMFTEDFTYEFSNTTDPDLVTKYSTGWFKADEKESSSHLFQGYTPPGGETLQPASTIDINLATTVPADDNGSTDPVTHKVMFTRVDGSIVIPPGSGQTQSTTYLIDNNQNAFYLVRGDQASLAPELPADDKHWYIYRWVDLSQQTGAAPSGGFHTAS